MGHAILKPKLTSARLRLAHHPRGQAIKSFFISFDTTRCVQKFKH